MSWLANDALSWFQQLVIEIIKVGRIPRHIAIIMDGNRRYAKKMNKDIMEGHSKGVDMHSKISAWCMACGVKELTIYAFSIENFKRSPGEVQNLLNLLYEKFEDFVNNPKAASGWRIRVVGNLDLLPHYIRKAAAKAEMATKDFTRAQLNIAVCYTARDEMTRAIAETATAVKEGALPLHQVKAETLSAAMDLTEPDLLIRTSGEVRLSDFMLWQLNYTVLYFVDVLWPEFSYWNWLKAILYYQVHAGKNEEALDDDEYVEMVKSRLAAKRFGMLDKYLNEVA